MTETVSATIEYKAKYTIQNTNELGTAFSEVQTVKSEFSLANGSGDSQINKVWIGKRTIAAGTNDDLDLTALTRSLFGDTITVSFSKVKLIQIINLNTTDGEDLELDGSVSNAFSGPFAGTTGKIPIPADSPLVLANKVSGWTVTAGTGDILRVANGTAAEIEYSILITGVE